MPALSYPVEELEDSPKEVWSRQSGPAHVRRFKVAWANRLQFKEDITALPYPGEAGLLVDNVSCDPFNKCPVARDTGSNMDPGSFLNSHQSAIVTVSYKAPGRGESREEERPDGTRLSFSREATGEFLTIPARGLIWPLGERLPPDAHPVMVISITRWKFRWSGIIRPPWTTIEKTKGRVNKESFSLPIVGLAAPPECLLFEGATQEVDAQFGKPSETTMALSYSFLQKQVYNLVDSDTLEVYGWNHAYNPSTGQWEKPQPYTVDGLGTPSPIPGAYLYATGDMSKLFIQATP